MSDEQNTDTATPEEASPEVVTRARELGWVPETEWKGTPPKNGFLPPDEFVRRGEKIMPIVRAENRKLQERLDRLETERQTERQEHRDTVKRIERMSSVALENQRSQIEARYAERKEAAVEVGDKAAYNQAVKDEKEAVTKLDDRLAEDPKDKAKDDKKVPELPREIQDTINGWNADNSWYGNDGEMTAVAQNHHAKLLKEKPGLNLRQNLDAVTEYVKKRYPEKFGEDAGEDEPTPRRGSAVEGGGRLGSGSGGSRSLYSKLPADAKAQADKFIKEDGLFLNKGETVEKNISQARERYAEQYLGDQA